MIKVITSKTNEKIKYAVSLKENKNRKKYQQFLGESKKSLELAVQAGVVKEVFTYDALDLPEDIVQYLVDENVMKKLSSAVHPEGVVFIADIPTFKKDKLNKILYLDGINDPGNLGTLVRTALAFDYDAVICSHDCVSIYNEKALASCKGSNYLIPVFVDELFPYKDSHQIIVSSLKEDSRDAKDIKKEERFVLVLGNEAHGVSKNSELLADISVKIDISNIDSLNVSIAGGILMFLIH